MNKVLLTAASMMALMSTTSANANEPTPPPPAQEQAKNTTLQDTTENTTPNTYRDITGAFTSGKDFKATNVEFNPKRAAANIIGQSVYNPNGEAVAKVKDIIVFNDGRAEMIILGDGDFSGWGKTVAYDFDIVANQTAEGDIVAPLTEETIAKAKIFSYDMKDSSETTQVIPPGSHSVAELLDAQVVDPEGNTLAQVDNFIFQDGAIIHLIIGFDKTFGIGGNQAALSYKDVKLATVKDESDFQLTAEQTAQLKDFIKAEEATN